MVNHLQLDYIILVPMCIGYTVMPTYIATCSGQMCFEYLFVLNISSFTGDLRRLQ